MSYFSAIFYIIKKITENCGDGFFARVISENTETIRNDVYASPADKEALRSSDALLTATDALNHIKTGGADEAVIGAFEACATANDHILYIARECEDKIVDYLENDACEPHKLTELVSEYTISGRKNMRVYDAIKKRFKSMPDESDTKLHFALMLGDYGEPNAILILRKYAKKLIEKYNENRDRELFSNIMMISSAVESLGGSTEDLFE